MTISRETNGVVAEGADGLDAIRLCGELRPDVLILDIGMPTLSGIEVAARVQKLDRPPGVIILSVHGTSRTSCGPSLPVPARTF